MRKTARRDVCASAVVTDCGPVFVGTLLTNDQVLLLLSRFLPPRRALRCLRLLKLRPRSGSAGSARPPLSTAEALRSWVLAG